MIRRWFSDFFKRNKGKFRDIGTKLIIVAIVVFIATIIISTISNLNLSNQDSKNLYKPEETVIKGSNVSEKQYQSDKNVVDKFLEYCNNGQVKEAYNLLNNDCKENLYPTLEIFKTSYYDIVFKGKKQYNLQSWISTSKYTVYKIRYTNNILASGKYNEDEIYNDYITLIKNQEREEISIGSFIMSEGMNKFTQKDGIEATVVRKHIYLEDEEYDINIKNTTQNTILLDTLENSNNIKLVTEVGNTHQTYTSMILKSKLTIKPGYNKTIKLKFKKSATNSSESKYIEFFEVIKNYEEYAKDRENYTDKMDLKINV